MMKLDIGEKILAGLFIQLSGNGRPIDLWGVRGWTSEFKEPYANRVGLISGDNQEKILQEVCQFFDREEKGFTLALGPTEIDSGLPVKLTEQGFIPSRFHRIAGMYLEPPYTSSKLDTSIRVAEVQINDFRINIELIAKSYGISLETAKYLYLPKTPPEFHYRSYLAYYENSVDPVGYCTSVHLPDNVLMLCGSGVLVDYRNKGLYSAMLQQRINDALIDNMGLIIVQSARHSSYNCCTRHGFIDAYDIEFYQRVAR